MTYFCTACCSSLHCPPLLGRSLLTVLFQFFMSAVPRVAHCFSLGRARQSRSLRAGAVSQGVVKPLLGELCS